MGWFGDQVTALGGDDFPAAVLALLRLILSGVVGWALLVALLGSAPALRHVAVALTPRVLRGVLFAGVAGTLAVPAAHADDRGVDGLRLPDRPTVAGTTHRPVEGARRVREVVAVRAGDTLWALARSRLRDRADVAAIARDVDRWYRTNHDVIGGDPDLIHPGQRLTAPSKERS
jgi:nucleoid-associated protein YgaU